jgi:hypothetical protein
MSTKTAATFLLSFLCSFSFFNINAQTPSNDECTGAISLSVNADNSCTSIYNGNTGYATQSMPSCVASGYDAKDVWFKFTATSTSHRITVTPTSYDNYVFQVFSGTCSSLTPLACINTGSSNEPDVTVLNNLTVGNVYYLRVYDYWGGGSPSRQFSICVNTSSTLLNNDDCSGALVVTPSADGNQGTSVSSNNTGATQSLPGCFGSAEDDVWFKFTATSSRHRIVVSTNEDINPVLEVFSGTCSSLQSLGCRYTNTASPYFFIDYDLTNLTAGNTYYYRVYGQSSNNIRTNISTYVTTPIGAQLPIPSIENISDKCLNAPNTSGKVMNPPAGATVTITQDGNTLSYNTTDSSFQYFAPGSASAGPHTITVKFNNGNLDSRKDTTYMVTEAIVPSFSFGNSLNICANSITPLLPSTSRNNVTGSWTPAVINNQVSGIYTFTPSAVQCATSTTVSVTVNPTITPSVIISTASSSICQGSSVSFSANAVNAGSATLQWKINGNNAANGTGFTTSTLLNNDMVQVELTSTLACANPTTVASNIITMQVNALLQPVISISGATTVVKGSSSSIIASITHGGNSPSYQWQDSMATTAWTNIVGATTSTLNYTPATTGVKLRCRLTSNEPCATSTVAMSQPLEFIVTVATAVGNLTNNYGLHLYPNPVTGRFIIDTLSLSDRWKTLDILSLQGKTVMTKNIQGQTIIVVDVSALPGGIFIVVLRKSSGKTTYLKFARL